MSRSRKFDEPIKLPNGKELLTIGDAADYILGLPKAERESKHWQDAAQALLLVKKAGPTMLARMVILNALEEKQKPRPFDRGF